LKRLQGMPQRQVAMRKAALTWHRPT
jgi:hypothetical protein